VVVLLDEISRLMPDDAWVSELRIDGDIVDMTGYARQATALLPLFEHSALFEDARFSSPVRFDPAQDRERFGLRVRLRRASETAGAMR
jgi:general secretion pathway protein L